MLGITTDPYMTPKDAWDYNPSFPDICVYFIHTPPYTKDELKAYKSTEAWAYFTAGYVSEVGLLNTTSQTCLLSAMVYIIYACALIVTCGIRCIHILGKA